jgi:hypothetical protein
MFEIRIEKTKNPKQIPDKVTRWFLELFLQIICL